ncbi:MAG: hypothetical protein HY721_06115 [Planctomycetes bacterium]|nr:hypothetical protein [Planctomycetota bacterium]
MLPRFLAALAIVCLIFFAGCQGCGESKNIGRPAPAFKVCNGPRLLTEAGWLYAEVQDVLFGVEHYEHIERQWGASPYDR